MDESWANISKVVLWPAHTSAATRKYLYAFILTHMCAHTQKSAKKLEQKLGLSAQKYHWRVDVVCRVFTDSEFIGVEIKGIILLRRLSVFSEGNFVRSTQCSAESTVQSRKSCCCAGPFNPVVKRGMKSARGLIFSRSACPCWMGQSTQ